MPPRKLGNVNNQFLNRTQAHAALKVTGCREESGFTTVSCVSQKFIHFLRLSFFMSKMGTVIITVLTRPQKLSGMAVCPSVSQLLNSDPGQPVHLSKKKKIKKKKKNPLNTIFILVPDFILKTAFFRLGKKCTKANTSVS